ncbi:MAG: hypothetical protein E2O84_07165 [Bacteroidetes bacterium]|nr:MAG: hypothetical protein E2O84_07165 [Bacteroidota bacterium]
MTSDTHAGSLAQGSQEKGASENGSTAQGARRTGYIIYLLIGLVFGIVLVKSQAVSWFRIQEMFRFQSFHMYGIIGSAVAVAALSLFLIKKMKLTSASGEPLIIEPKEFEGGKSQMFGGIIFGAGWALLGACPGPIFALIGTGTLVLLVALLSAVTGAWMYGLMRPFLPQ